MIMELKTLRRKILCSLEKNNLPAQRKTHFRFFVFLIEKLLCHSLSERHTKSSFTTQRFGLAISQSTVTAPLGPGSWHLTSFFFVKLRKQWNTVFHFQTCHNSHKKIPMKCFLSNVLIEVCPIIIDTVLLFRLTY